MTGTYRRISIDPYLARNPEAAAYLRPDFTDFATSRWEDDEIAPSHRGRAIVRSWDFLPLDVTTCRELVPAGFWLNPVYDVNGYYRALGIGWPFRPTKRELMRGLPRQRRASATSSPRTRLKRLLDKEIRAAYDARPYGQPMDDKYRWLELSRKAARWAAEETLRSGRYRDSSEFVPADIRARMESDMRREGDQTESIREVPAVDWGFGYYRWDAVRRRQGGAGPLAGAAARRAVAAADHRPHHGRGDGRPGAFRDPAASRRL